MNSLILYELIHIIKIFLYQPLLYWSLFFIIYTHIERKKREQLQFRYSYVPLFAHFRKSAVTALLFGIVLSLITVGLGTVFTYEMITILTIVTFILTILFRHVAFSAIYPFAITFVLFYKLIPQSSVAYYDISSLTFTGLMLIASVLLLYEGILLQKVDHTFCYPAITLSKRGKWYAFFNVKRVQLIPTLLLVPDGFLQPIAHIWPLFSLGTDSYGLILFPFVTGFRYKIKSELPLERVKKHGRVIFSLGLIVAILAIISYFYPSIVFVAIFIGVVGRMMIQVITMRMERKKPAKFVENDSYVQIVAIRPHSLAEKLSLAPGDVILHINEQQIETVEQLDDVLATSDEITSLKVKSRSNTIRKISYSFTCSDRHELGVIIAAKPF
ncbi:MAG TPA: PDZ domain-containing protein [Pseudogracilibacillus sp.]|nr:PDZ domain-containing protein [Pseudogracilibacillus sp.]